MNIMNQKYKSIKSIYDRATRVLKKRATSGSSALSLCTNLFIKLNAFSCVSDEKHELLKNKIFQMYVKY